MTLKARLDEKSLDVFFRLTDDLIVVLSHVVGIDLTGISAADRGAGFKLS